MFTSLQCIWTLLRICYQKRSQVTCTFSGELNSKVHSQVPVIPVKASWLLVSRGYHGQLITSCSRATPAFRFAPPTPYCHTITDNTAFPCTYVHRKRVALSVLPIGRHTCYSVAYSDYSHVYTLGGKQSLLMNCQLFSLWPKAKELLRNPNFMNGFTGTNQWRLL